MFHRNPFAVFPVCAGPASPEDVLRVVFWPALNGEYVMKKPILSLILGASVLLMPAFAFAADNSPGQSPASSAGVAPLAPGGAAGITKAQGSGATNTALLVGGGVIVAGGLALALSNHSGSHAPGTTTTGTTGTTSTH